MLARLFASVFIVTASPAGAQPGAAQLREQVIYERHDPKDYHGELKAALARFSARDGRQLANLTADPFGFEIRETSAPPHPVRHMWLQETISETKPQPNGGTVTHTIARPRGIAAISSIGGRMTVEAPLLEAEIRERPRRVYEILPSRLCPQVLAAFDIRTEPHTADPKEREAMAALDARFPELQRVARANAQEVELTRVDEAAPRSGVHPYKGAFGFLFGKELPPLTERETRDVVTILRSPSSYQEGFASGCMFSPVIAIRFPSQDDLAALICFRCNQIEFVRGKTNLSSNDLTGPAAQSLLDAVRRVMPTLPEKLPDPTPL